ncbi:MAG: hypothetical protein WC408_02430 [Candidatus Micrarchaeia archaeon]|jgi:hypothetical protein
MALRTQEITFRRIQFVALILLVIFAVVLLVNSDLAGGLLFGISMKAVYGFVGMCLVVVVAISGQKMLFSNLPQDSAEGDAISKAEGIASEKPLGRLAEITYSKRRQSNKEVPFEGMFRKGE